MKPPIRFAWFLTIFFCAPSVLLTVTATNAYAQDVPPIILPALSLSTLAALILPLLLGTANQLAQKAVSGGSIGPWRVSAAIGPYAVVIGSFLDGFTKTLSSYNWQVTGATVVYSFVAGVAAFLLGSAPAAVVHHFGGAVNARRPKALPPTVKPS